MVAGTEYTSCGKTPQTYESPYGPFSLERHVYQSPQGGKRFCPLSSKARMVLNFTPLYAKFVSSKMGEMSGPSIKSDLSGNHGRAISLDYAKSLADEIGRMALAKEGAGLTTTVR
jgi:hypothetical protein